MLNIVRVDIQYLKKLLLSLTLTLLTACGGGDTAEEAVNTPPVSNAGEDQSTLAGEAVTLAGSGSDAEGDDLSYKWSQLSGETVALNDSAINSPTFTAPLVVGPLTFRLTVTDGEGATHSDEVVVQVNNNSPVANANVDQSVQGGALVTLSGSGSDVENNNLTYSWLLTSGTSVTLNNPSTASPSFTAPLSVGTLTFTLTVTDSEGDSHKDSMNVVINNIPPVANSGDDLTTLGLETVTLNGSSSDANGSVASFQWQQTMGDTVTLNDANSYTPSFKTPATDQTLRFELSVTDDQGATVSDSVDVTVDNELVKPTQIGQVAYSKTDQVTYPIESDCSAFLNSPHPSFYQSVMNPVHSLDSERFTYYWPKDYSNLSQELKDLYTLLETDPVLRNIVATNLNEMMPRFQNISKIDVNPFYNADDGKCYKINLYAQGFNSRYGPTQSPGMGCDNEVNKTPFIVLWNYTLRDLSSSNAIPSVLYHEFAHALQCEVPRVYPDGWDWYIESYASYFSIKIAIDDANLAKYRSHSFWAVDAWRIRYQKAYYWHYLYYRFGHEYMADVMQRVALPGESALEFVHRTAPFDCASNDNDCRDEAFANLFGDLARNNVNFVEQTVETGLDYYQMSTYPNGVWYYGYKQLSAEMRKVDDTRYRIVDWLAPQRFSYNVIELIPDPTDQYLKITLDGWNIPDRRSEWRATVVATFDDTSVPRDEDYGKTFKSGTQIIDLDAWENAKGSTIKKLDIVVAAVPKNWKRESELSLYSSAQRYRELDRYVYELDIQGAYPAGHEPEALREPTGYSGAPHPNGGGFVADTATVAPTAYVGPDARVLGYVQVLGDARIEGRGLVDNGFNSQTVVVQDNAIVSSTAEINDRATISGYATVRDDAAIRIDARVRGNGGVYGGTQLWGDHTVQDKGLIFGGPNIETTLGSTIVGGTSIVDTWAEYSGTLTQGTTYDNWSVNDNGRVLKYDFEQAHTYRIRDTHISNDAYYLALNDKITTAVPLQNDTTLNSQVLVLSGEGYVELPKMLLDRRDYQLNFKLNWQGEGSATEYVLDAQTDREEQLAIQLIPAGGGQFDLKLIFKDRNSTERTILLQDASFQAGAWLDITIDHNDTNSQITFSALPTIGGTPLVTATDTLPSYTREFDYDTLFLRLGSRVDGQNALSALIDDVELYR